MAFLYILLTAKNRYYIGSTDDLEHRLQVHQGGKVKTTKSALPVKLVHSEIYATRGDAQKREYQIKKWKSRKIIEAIIQSQKV